MSKISVIIPFRDQGDRGPQLEWLRGRYAALAPDFEVIVQSDDGQDPFAKTIAVNEGFKRATGDIIAVIDADVWVEADTLREAANMIRAGKAVWVRPADTVLRLSETFTQLLISLNPNVDTPDVRVSDCDAIGHTVGLAFVVSAEHFRGIGGMDPRFRGWGWEDNAFNAAMRILYGRELLFNKNLIHLWHPRPKNKDGKRIWEGQEQRNNEIGGRYSKAKKNREWMRRLVEEYRPMTGIKR